ncbi:MAG TPA: hypothetical protein VM754_07830 [Actinomycetota bacterium]|nr:hypothetical protein [Actinomycetota bacterium]
MSGPAGAGGPWDELSKPAPGSVMVGGTPVGPGSRVRLWPSAGGDLIDIELAGRTALVEGVDQDLDDNCYLAVTLDEDPGQDLGHYRQPGHRFFFRTEEVEPLVDGATPTHRARILVAGIGDEFKGDSGFGLEVVRRLAGRRLPGVTATEFGIRLTDLGRTLEQQWDAVIAVAAVTGGGTPGGVSIAEANPGSGPSVQVAGLGKVSLPVNLNSAEPGPRVWVAACEPARPGEDPAAPAGLSTPVLEAVDRTVTMIERLASQVVSAPDVTEQERS